MTIFLTYSQNAQTISTDNISQLLSGLNKGLPSALNYLQSSDNNILSDGFTSILHSNNPQSFEAIQNFGNLFGGPIGILNFMTPNFRKTNDRGQLNFAKEDGTFNTYGALLKLTEYGLARQTSNVTGQKVDKNDGLIDLTETLLVNSLDKKIDSYLGLNQNSKIQKPIDNVTKINCGCSQQFVPVCGVNGKTYGNSCLAACEKTEVLLPGFCQKGLPSKNSNVIDQIVKNNVNPLCQKCSQVQQPVCGNDNTTYNNICLAECKGLGIKYSGPCK